MSEAIKNRYEFVVLFDVRMEILMAIRTRETCRISTRKVVLGW